MNTTNITVRTTRWTMPDNQINDLFRDSTRTAVGSHRERHQPVHRQRQLSPNIPLNISNKNGIQMLENKDGTDISEHDASTLAVYNPLKRRNLTYPSKDSIRHYTYNSALLHRPEQQAVGS